MEATLSDVLQTLGKLEGKLESGFKSTHERLDTLNSKVATHEGRLNHMDVEDAKNAVLLQAQIDLNKKSDALKADWLKWGAMFLVTAMLNLGLIVLIRTGIVDIKTQTPTDPEAIQERTIELKAETEKLQSKLESQ